MFLRHFLYLDAALVEQYLAQLESGVVTEQRLATTGEREAGGEVRIALPAMGFKGGGRKVRGEAQEASYAMTPHAQFNRLHDILDPVALDEDSSDLMDHLDLRNIVEISCSVEIASLFKIAQNVDGLKALGSVIQRTGGDSEGSVGEVLGQMDMISGLLDGRVFVATTDLEDRDGGPALLFRMDRACVQREIADVEGEVTILARVTARFGVGDPVPIYTIPGVGAFSRKQRRDFQRNQRDNATMMTRGPAVSLDTIAVYT